MRDYQRIEFRFNFSIFLWLVSIWSARHDHIPLFFPYFIIFSSIVYEKDFEKMIAAKKKFWNFSWSEMRDKEKKYHRSLIDSLIICSIKARDIVEKVFYSNLEQLLSSVCVAAPIRAFFLRFSGLLVILQIVFLFGTITVVVSSLEISFKNLKISNLC